MPNTDRQPYSAGISAKEQSNCRVTSSPHVSDCYQGNTISAFHDSLAAAVTVTSLDHNFKINTTFLPVLLYEFFPQSSNTWSFLKFGDLLPILTLRWILRVWVIGKQIKTSGRSNCGSCTSQFHLGFIHKERYKASRTTRQYNTP